MAEVDTDPSPLSEGHLYGVVEPRGGHIHRDTDDTALVLYEGESKEKGRKEGGINHILV